MAARLAAMQRPASIASRIGCCVTVLPSTVVDLGASAASQIGNSALLMPAEYARNGGREDEKRGCRGESRN